MEIIEKSKRNNRSILSLASPFKKEKKKEVLKILPDEY